MERPMAADAAGHHDDVGDGAERRSRPEGDPRGSRAGGVPAGAFLAAIQLLPPRQRAVLRPFALIVLRPKAGLLAAMEVFEAPGLFAAFALPASLDA
ncbi:hypothetical protein GA0070613_3353 [Micromonospora inositola]|uniref:Uncharacterized protein n=2 Tax=Micromonospora inositola TaxID=47865 RepID=A0A1C5IS39_9ACTN|nr:hypothetical protein GA0070613_3353 [Micromonospora inositola]